MDASFLRNIAAHISSVPPLPAAAQKLIQLTGNPNVNIKEVGQVISVDIGIASKLLQIVNSPFYGLRQKINTVPQAITLIGLEAVRSLALSLSVIKTNPNDKGSIHLNQEDFWRHSLTTAILAKKLAPLVSKTDPEEAFIAGLMHDMGKLVLLEFTKNTYEIALEQASKAKMTLAALEREIFEMNHAVLAEELCRHWMIPESITNAIGKHHEPLIKQEPQPDQALAEVISLANQIAHIMGIGRSGNELISLEAIKYINLKKVDFDTIQKTVKTVTKGVEDAAKLFGFKEQQALEEKPLPIAILIENPEEKMLLQMVLSSKNYPIIDLSKEALGEDRLNVQSVKGIIHDKTISDMEKERLKSATLPLLDLDQWKHRYSPDEGIYPISILQQWISQPS